MLVHAVGLAREAKQHVGDGTVNMKKTKNPVAKHARTFNKATVMTDRKKREKAGYTKHKNAHENVDATTKERDKAQLKLRHAKQRHTLSVNQEKEKERVKNEAMEEGRAVTWTSGEKPDKKYLYAVIIDGKEEGTYHSLNQAKRVVTNLKKVASYRKYSIKRMKRTGAYTHESVEQVDELKRSTIATYAMASSADRLKSAVDAYDYDNKAKNKKQSKAAQQSYKKMASDSRARKDKRQKGIDLAMKKLDRVRKEEVEQVDEVYLNVMKTHAGETFRSGTFTTKKQADDHHWKMTQAKDKRGKKVFKSIETTKEEVEQVAESQVLSNKRRELSAKMFGDVKYLNPAQRKELDKAAKAAVKADREAKKAAPKKVTKTSKGKTHTGSGDPADRNLIMQLRKAQDVDGKMDIQVTPTGKTVRLPKSQIDALLKKHDGLGKPVDKRKFKIMLTKALRAKAK